MPPSPRRGDTIRCHQRQSRCVRGRVVAGRLAIRYGRVESSRYACATRSELSTSQNVSLRFLQPLPRRVRRQSVRSGRIPSVRPRRASALSTGCTSVCGSSCNFPVLTNPYQSRPCSHALVCSTRSMTSPCEHFAPYRLSMLTLHKSPLAEGLCLSRPGN